MTNLCDLAGRICFVTGAGQGVGRQVALHLARNNAGGVVINDFFTDRAAAVAAEVEEAGAKAIAVQADVSNLADVQRAVDEASAAFGRIDVLVNNAGNMGPDASAVSGREFWETDPDEWNAWIGVNLNGVLNCSRAVLPGMVERNGGRLITVISDAGRVGEPRAAVYSAAKAGAAGFTRSIAKEAGKYGITANCVAIGATRTPALVAQASEERLATIARAYPMRRIGEPDDPANMIVFLSSDAASFVTGQTIPVNGGYSFAV
jgi:3-oxoacyl-[acyl-carrier protein] reductase